jgi:hypothetical protein
VEAYAQTTGSGGRRMKKEDFQPGQTVYLLPVRYIAPDYLRIEKRIVEATVLSVGRKYITCDFGRKIQFDISNNFTEVTSYSIDYKLFLSKEDIKVYFKRRKMEERVSTAFHFPNHVARKMTFDELETVFNIVKKYSKY